MRVAMQRTVTVVRGEVGTVSVRFVPTSEFESLPKGRQAELRAEVDRLTPCDLHAFKESGGMTITDYLCRYFDVEVSDLGNWEYDNGEVNVIAEGSYKVRR